MEDNENTTKGIRLIDIIPLLPSNIIELGKINFKHIVKFDSDTQHYFNDKTPSIDLDELYDTYPEIFNLNFNKGSAEKLPVPIANVIDIPEEESDFDREGYTNTNINLPNNNQSELTPNNELIDNKGNINIDNVLASNKLPEKPLFDSDKINTNSINIPAGNSEFTNQESKKNLFENNSSQTDQDNNINDFQDHNSLNNNLNNTYSLNSYESNLNDNLNNNQNNNISNVAPNNDISESNYNESLKSAPSLENHRQEDFKVNSDNFQNNYDNNSDNGNNNKHYKNNFQKTDNKELNSRNNILGINFTSKVDPEQIILRAILNTEEELSVEKILDLLLKTNNIDVISLLSLEGDLLHYNCKNGAEHDIFAREKSQKLYNSISSLGIDLDIETPEIFSFVTSYGNVSVFFGKSHGLVVLAKDEEFEPWTKDKLIICLKEMEKMFS